MFDIGWSELLLVAVLAVIFIGPKDLPRVMRTAGRYAGRMRAMAREFQNSFEDLARETELDELRREVSSLRDSAMKPLGNLGRPADLMTGTTPMPEIKPNETAPDSDKASEAGPAPVIASGEPGPAKHEAGQG
ncbi:MAG TPA: Sec-independent protein translocase protein TatB [Parvibaculum sp.]